jgi:hypothetical protein
MRPKLAAALLALASALAPVAPVRAADPAPVDAAWLAGELQRGGYLVFFRHTSTYREDIGMESRNVAAGTLALDDCATQRNLNEAGVSEARRQAEIVARLGIPVGKAYVSRYCRARDHVRWFAVEAAPSDTLTPVRDAAKAKALRAMFATPPAAGTNTFFFAHGGILWQATDYDSEEAETFVFRPGDPATLVAAIKMRDWDALAARAGACCAPRPFWGGGPAPKE